MEEVFDGPQYEAAFAEVGQQVQGLGEKIGQDEQRMAQAMQSDLEALREGWRARGYDIDAGMGIHSGYATVGFIGYEGRRDYAVIGNVTNLAARLSDAASADDILVTGSVRAELKNGLRTEAAGTLSLKGISRPQPVFRLLESLP